MERRTRWASHQRTSAVGVAPVTANTAPIEMQPKAQRHRRPEKAALAQSRLPVSAVTLCAATGVLIVAATYTVARMGYSSSRWADVAYWLGQALIVVPIAIRLLGRRALAESGTVTLVVVLTVAEYLVKVCYSPVAFAFSDELQHQRSTINLLQTGKLFTTNYQMPISPHYPGLEEVTAAVASVTGLPLFASGLIVAGTAHLLFVCLLYLLFRYISGLLVSSPTGAHRLAGIAVIIYSGNPDLQSFDSMFAYQTVAIAFLGLAVLAAWRLVERDVTESRAGWFIVAVLAIVATVITHHVTSYMLVATLILVGVVSLATGQRREAVRLAGLALTTAGAIACWVKFAAPGTVSYLAPVASELASGWQSVLGLAGAAAPSPTAGPLGNRVLAAVSVLTMSALVLAGVWQAWRHYRRQAWVAAMAVGALGWFAIVLVRLRVPDGSQLAGRAATFVFVPTAFIVAITIAQIINARWRWKSSFAAAGVIAAGLVLLVDGLANGWPPYWERLPGTHQVAGAERSVTPDEIAVANWALTALGPGNRFAADYGSYPVLGGYGNQNPIRNDAYLYTSATFSRADAALVKAQAIGFILVDRRLSQSLPASGQYFPGVDPGADQYTSPLPLAGLTKFNAIPGVDRLYDAGDIVVYDLRGSLYYAP